MKEYTKTITVQAVQWNGDLDALSDFLANNKITTYDWYVRDMKVLFSNEFDSLVCEDGHYLVCTELGGTDILMSVSPEDFLRDYKEVTE